MPPSRLVLAVALALGWACAPKSPHQPPTDTGQLCTGSKACSSGLCVKGVCTSSCDSSAECLSGWSCESADGGSSTCACVPSPELCDGKDNDCDGLIDDAPEADQDCRQQGSGFACRAGTCECTGTTACGGCVDLATDPQHCGACGTACSAEASAAPFCAAGQCATLETVAPNDGGGLLVFAVDAEHLYMSDVGIGRIDQWFLADASHIKLSADTGGLVLALTADDANVYWAADSLGADWSVANQGAIFRVPVGGGETIELATNQAPSFGLVVDETHVYWTAQPPVDELHIRTGPGQVLKVPKEGGEVSVVADQQDGPWGIAVDATNVYWTNYTSGTVMKQAKAGGAPVVLASGQAGPAAITVDATSVYWTNVGVTNGTRTNAWVPSWQDPFIVPRTGSVMKVPLEGGTPVVLASEQDAPSWGIAVDGSHVYWLNSQLVLTRTQLGALKRVPIAGGEPSTLVAEQLHPWGLALANGGIYWSAGDFVPFPLGSPLTHGKVQKLVLRDGP